MSKKAIATGLRVSKQPEKQLVGNVTLNPLPDLRPRPYLVAFIDILGFGREIENARTEEDLRNAYAKVRKVQEEFQHPSASSEPARQTENNSEYGRRVLALSDAVVVAITPTCPMQPLMGGYDLLGFALFELIVAQARCACQGIFVRGGISHGSFFFENDVLLSPALARAYELESKHAEYPLIVIPQSTRDAVLDTPKMGSYAPGADPTPPYFIKHGKRKLRNEPLFYLDYMGVMLQEDHRGWLPEDRKKYLAARRRGDDERAQELLNLCARKDAAYFLEWHRKKLEQAYKATNSERVRKKYRWLMAYHNRSFPHSIGYVRDQVIDLTKFQPSKK